LALRIIEKVFYIFCDFHHKNVDRLINTAYTYFCEVSHTNESIDRENIMKLINKIIAFFNNMNVSFGTFNL